MENHEKRNAEMGERVVWLDLLRVIAIFCMMVLHVCASQFDSVDVSSYDWQVFNVYDSLVRFCVPVFVMISGVFFLNPEKEYPLKKLLKKNVLRMATAYLFWAFCYAVAEAFVEYKALNGDFWSSVLQNTITGRYHLWFINMITGIYLVVPFLRKIAENKKLLEYYIALSFFAGYVGNLVTAVPFIGDSLGEALDKMSLYMVLGYTGYFMAGYYFYTYEISRKMRNATYLLGGVSVIVTIVGTSAISSSDGVAKTTLYNNLLPTICLCAWAVFLFFREQVSKVRFSKRSGERIVALAGLSFGMYLVHDFVNIALKLAGITTTSFQPLLSVPALACIVFAVSFVIIWVMSRIPFARKYLM